MYGLVLFDVLYLCCTCGCLGHLQGLSMPLACCQFGEGETALRFMSFVESKD
jgi:hypothetical protein